MRVKLRNTEDRPTTKNEQQMQNTDSGVRKKIKE